MKNIRSLLVAVLVLTTVVFSTQSVLAITSTTGDKEVTTRMANLKTRAEKEIERRITAINKAINKINDSKKLSTSEKTALVEEIQQEITSLTSLKAKVNADTDLATLKVDVMSIVKSYRIFVVQLPKVRIIAHADLMLINADRISELATKLNTRIQAEKAKGKDVKGMETAYNAMIASINNAKSEAQNAKDSVMGLTPEGYPDNKAVLVTAKDTLKKGRTDLKDALENARSIVKELKADNK